MAPDLKRLTQYLLDLGLREVAHYPSGGPSLLAHSLGVYHLMHAWGCTEELCRAGLFHQIYGVQGWVAVFALDLVCRDEVRALIGERAERLAYLNCAMERASFDVALTEPAASCQFRDHFTGEPIRLAVEDFDDLCRVNLYDWLEQVARRHDWDYRRTAYQRMAARLGGKAQEAYDSVYAREPA